MSKPKPRLFDIHTHVQFRAFKDDLDAVTRRALDQGIWLVNVGTQKDTSAEAVQFVDNYPDGVFATVGLHPIHTEKSFHDEKEFGVKDKELSGFESRGEEFDHDYYQKLAVHPKVVAIGECGLDYYRFKNEDPGFKNKQKDVFIKQIELAMDVKKPLMIHCRDAFHDLIQILKSYNLNLKPPGIIHFFSGTKEDAQSLMDLGFSFSFGGVITFARNYDEVVRYIPMDRILLETDAPYVTPVPYRGKRNEPVNVTEVAKKIAEIKGVDYEEVARLTTENARKIFKI